jgi:fibronectin type 3 domain-containing protein
MKNYERYFFTILGLTLTLVFSACSIPFDKFENIEVEQKPDISAIPIPKNVTAKTMTASRIDLAWQANSIAASYSVYRSTAEDGDYTAIVTVQETSYTDNNASADTEYFYYITLSANNMGESGKSATVQADTKPPMPPKSISAVGSESTTKVTVTWQTAAAADSYKVYRAIGQDSGYTAITPEPVTATSYSDEAVSLGNDYYYRVASINNLGEGEKSVYAISSVHVPAAPESVSTSVESPTKITITWQPVAAAESYKVYRSDAQDSGYAVITPLPITATSYSDETVSLGNDYYYRVTSVNSIGEGEQSAYAVGSVKAPAVPQGLTAVPASESSIKLEWHAVDGVTGYEVHRSTSSGGAYTKQADTTDTTWTDNGLTPNTIYYYETAAVNGLGTSGLSPEVSGGTMGTMGTPTVIADTGQLTVSWAAVARAGEYEVYCDTSSAPTTLYTTVSGTTVTIAGLTNGTLYYVRLKAKNTTGKTAYGGTASGTPAITPGLYDNVIDAAHKIGSQNLTAGLSYISANAETGHEYFIVVGADESVAGSTLSYSGKTVGITLMGIGEERTISLGVNGALFSVGTGVTLTLDENITLVGRSYNVSLVGVSGTLVMNNGSKITGNTASTGGGAAVSVIGGAFNMKGGTISGNTVSSTAHGGGVYIYNGTFTMEGGTISGNTVSGSGHGGGVYVTDGIFTMTGGTISGNSTSYSYSIPTFAGGVYISGGTFTMEGGTISGNVASASASFAYGGGVVSAGTFTMKGGTISGNTASSVSASAHGGGVYISGGTFTMKGGTINGNTASIGGGVSVSTSGTFKKSPGADGSNSGIIYGSETVGNDAKGVPLKNTATDSSGGSAVYAYSYWKRNTTAGQTDYIDTSNGLGLSASGNPPF